MTVNYHWYTDCRSIGMQHARDTLLNPSKTCLWSQLPVAGLTAWKLQIPGSKRVEGVGNYCCLFHLHLGLFDAAGVSSCLANSFFPKGCCWSYKHHAWLHDHAPNSSCIGCFWRKLYANIWCRLFNHSMVHFWGFFAMQVLGYLPYPSGDCNFQTQTWQCQASQGSQVLVFKFILEIFWVWVPLGLNWTPERSTFE